MPILKPLLAFLCFSIEGDRLGHAFGIKEFYLHSMGHIACFAQESSLSDDAGLYH